VDGRIVKQDGRLEADLPQLLRAAQASARDLLRRAEP